ncbi:MAG: cob(I)yrinic acid a,c-diamide adenosyltransferase, partial [Oscillospiraceae bacterium]
MPIENGLIHIYCGNGKGKTTAAVGLAIRAIGQGNFVCFSQFLKSAHTGELNVFEEFENIHVIRSNEKMKFTYEMTKEELDQCAKTQQQLMVDTIDYCRKNPVNMVVFDEIVAALNKGMVDAKMFVDFLDTRPKNLEVVITGRNPVSEIMKRAD